MDNSPYLNCAPEDHAHVYDVFVEYIMDPTCVRDGIAQYACVCGELEPETRVVPASVGYHEWKEVKTVDGKTSKAATCLEDGLQYSMCTICKEVKSEVIEASDAYHQYGSVPTTVEGQNVYECTVCHYLRKEVIDCEHNYEEYSNTATCTEAGVIISVCTKCQDIKREDVVALGHKIDLKATDTRIITEKTCYTDGEASGVCINDDCGKTVRVVIPASHNFGDKDDADKSQNATCEEDGWISKICLDCPYQVLETVKAKGHAEPTDKNTIEYWAVKPIIDEKTGEVTGYESYTKADSKNNLTSTISTMTSSEIKEYLCNYGIVKVYTCNSVSNSEEHFTKGLSCENHEVEAEDGTKTTVSAVKAQVEFYAYVGHKYITQTPAECDKEGTKFCTVCAKEEKIPFLTHDFKGSNLVEVDKVVTSADGKTTTTKVKTAYCKRCNKSIEVDVTAVKTTVKASLDSAKTELEQKVAKRMDAVKITPSGKTVTIEPASKGSFTSDLMSTNKNDNCFGILLTLANAKGEAIKADNVKIISSTSGTYSFNPDGSDTNKDQMARWGAVDPEHSFMIWLAPEDFAKYNGSYSITFTDKTDANAYPITITFELDKAILDLVK